MTNFNGSPEASQPLEQIGSHDLTQAISALIFAEPEADAESSGAKAGGKRAMNSTAYRIFKLLQWLLQSPLSVDALNRRFCADPFIGKPVSNDSIWLYINTLKALGCNIRRPSPKNDFQYEMISHPFGMALTDAQLDALSQAKAFAQQRFSRQEMYTLDGLLKKIVSFTVCDDPQVLVDQLFSRSRSFDYDEIRHHLEALEQSAARQQLLRLTYLSPKHGKEQFSFLPGTLFYEQGVVYVRGERPEFNHPSNLRVDRILAVEPVDEPALKNQLLDRQHSKTEVIIQVFAARQDAFAGFGLGENQGVYQEDLCWVGPSALEAGKDPYFEVTLMVREFFSLKQKLLLLGLPFRILGPESLREDVRKTLEAMRQFYQGPLEADNLGDIAHG